MNKGETKCVDFVSLKFTNERRLSDSSVDWDAFDVQFTELLQEMNSPPGSSSALNRGEKRQVDMRGITSSGEARAKHRENVGLSIVSSRENTKALNDVKKKKEALIDLTIGEANKALSNEDYNEAVTGGLLCLKFIQTVFGSTAIEQVEPLFLLAKANQCKYLKCTS